MRFDKQRNAIELKDLVGGKIIGSEYMGFIIEKDGRKFKVEFDYEYGYYPDDVSMAYEIKEVGKT